MSRAALVLAIILVVAVLLAMVFHSTNLLSHEGLESLDREIHEHQRILSAALLFLGVYVALGLVGLPVVTLLSPIGGYLFGFWPGMLLSAAGALAAGMLTYWGARLWLGRWLGKKYSVKERWFRRELNRRGAGLLLMMRLLLVVPFVWINALAGLARVNWLHFFWTLVAGCVPVAALYAFAGSQLRGVHTLRDVFSPHVAGAFLLLAGVLAVRLLWLRQARRRNR